MHSSHNMNDTWIDTSDMDEAWVEMGLLVLITWMGMSSLRIMRQAYDAAKEMGGRLDRCCIKPTTTTVNKKSSKKVLQGRKRRRMLRALLEKPVVSQATQTETPLCSPPLSPKGGWNEPEYVFIDELDMSCIPPA